MTELKRVLMQRDGLSAKEADEQINEMRSAINDGDDPEDVLLDYGLEADYFFDLI